MGAESSGSSSDNTVRVWEVSSGNRLHTPVFEFPFASLENSLRSFPMICSLDSIFLFLGGICCRLVCTRCGQVSHGVPLQSLALLLPSMRM